MYVSYILHPRGFSILVLLLVLVLLLLLVVVLLLLYQLLHIPQSMGAAVCNSRMLAN